MKFVKLAAIAAIAASVAGCGKDDGAKDAKAASNASAPAAAAEAPAGKPVRVHSPKILSNAELAVQFRASDAPALKPFRELFKALVNLAVAEDKSGADELKSFLAASGLSGADVKWGLVTVGGVRLADIEKEGAVPEIAVAVSLTHDLVRIIDAVKADNKEKAPQFVEFDADGVKAWKIFDKEMLTDNVTPVVASLDGTLLLAASDAAVLRRLVALYRDGRGESAAFAKMASASNDEVVRAFIPSVGKLVKDAFDGSEDALSIVDMMVPDGSKLLLGLGELNYALSASGGSVVSSTELVTASDDDADTIRTLLKTAIMPLKANLKESTDKEDQLAYSAIKDIKVGGEGKTVSVVMPIPAEVVEAVADEMLKGAFIGGGDDSDDDDD